MSLILIGYYKDNKHSFNDSDIIEDGESPNGCAYLSYEVDVVKLSDKFDSSIVYEITLVNQLEEEETCFVFKVRRNRWDSGRFSLVYDNDYKLSDLRHLSSFEMYLIKLKQNMCWIDFSDDGGEVIEGEVCVEFEY